MSNRNEGYYSQNLGIWIEPDYIEQGERDAARTEIDALRERIDQLEAALDEMVNHFEYPWNKRLRKPFAETMARARAALARPAAEENAP